MNTANQGLITYGPNPEPSSFRLEMTLPRPVLAMVNVDELIRLHHLIGNVRVLRNREGTRLVGRVVAHGPESAHKQATDVASVLSRHFVGTSFQVAYRSHAERRQRAA